MTKEQIKAKAKGQFPNDEFKQQAVIDAINWAIKELEKENAELKHTIAILRQEKDNVSMHAKAMEVVAKTRNEQLIKAEELLKQFIFLLHNPRTALDTKTVMDEAEQFLKDNA